MEVTGQVVHRRSVSKKLLFLDILREFGRSDIVSNVANNSRVTVMLKNDICGEELLKLARCTTSKIHVGDVVCFCGNFEDDTSIFLPSSFIVVSRWEKLNPGKPFCSIPPASTSKNINESSEHSVCKYFVNTGKCPKTKCKYLHIDDPKNKQHYLKAKAKCHISGNTRRSDKNFKEGENNVSTVSTEHLESRHARARIFVKWLATKFLQEELKLTASTKTVIYDVAGGKGEIAFELCIRQKEMLTEDLQCIIIDPRKPNKFETGALPRWQKKMIKKSRYNGNVEDDPGLKDQPHYTSESKGYSASYKLLNVIHYQELFDESFCDKHFGNIDNDKVQLNESVLQEFIIGMHPDQATEAIVDMALKYRKPFAVVPCCVFAHENPHRRLKDQPDIQPTSYEDFCQYLMEKDEHIRSDQLTFEGRNQVLYWNPSR